MLNFTYHCPTKIIFGKDAELAVGGEVARLGYKKVFILYGGKSAVESGLIRRVEQSLTGAGLEFTEMGGVAPNPQLSFVRKAAEACSRYGADFILGVGGGSVIDAAKAVGLTLRNDFDIWDIFTKKRQAQGSVPLGAVVTIAAAGTESSPNSVITHDGLKLGCWSDYIRPAFAIMNPELTYTVPEYHTACGIVDILMHTLDRYFSDGRQTALVDAISEALLSTTLRFGKIAMQNPESYEARAELLWAGSISHNGLTGTGKNVNMMCHHIEHRLSAIFDVAHGAGLAAIWGSWARHVYRRYVPLFARLAVNVMGIAMDYDRPEETALDGIFALEKYFSEIAMPVNLPQLLGRKATDEEIAVMASAFAQTPGENPGLFVPLTRRDVAEIYRAANERE